MSLVSSLPPRVQPFFSGRWPWLWLAAICGYLIFGEASPRWLDAAEARETADIQRGLVERQRAVALRQPDESARRDAALAWWREGEGQRVRGATLAQATADLQERVRRLVERPGLTVAKLEAAAPETLSDKPQAQIVRLTVRLAAERMEPLSSALTALEMPSPQTPWLRVGNTTITANLYRLPGVQAETTIYACVEAGS